MQIPNNTKPHDTNNTKTHDATQHRTNQRENEPHQSIPATRIPVTKRDWKYDMIKAKPWAVIKTATPWLDPLPETEMWPTTIK